jgi:hypothetical protein
LEYNTIYLLKNKVVTQRRVLLDASLIS